MLEFILADQLADLPPILASSGQEWQFYISTVRVHIGRSTGRSTPPLLASHGQEWKFYISAVRVHIGRANCRCTPHTQFSAIHHGMSITGCIWQSLWILQEKVGICFYFWIIRVVISQHCRVLSDLTLLDTPNAPKHPHMTITDFNYESSYVDLIWMLELILADQLANLPPILASCGQEWQFYISTVRVHIGRSTGRSTPQYLHLVVKNCNFTFLLLRVQIGRSTGRSPPTSVQCIMECLLWDVFGSHCGFCKKRWEFAFISE